MTFCLFFWHSFFCTQRESENFPMALYNSKLTCAEFSLIIYGGIYEI